MWMGHQAESCGLSEAVILSKIGSVANKASEFFSVYCEDRLCGLVVRVPGYRSIGPGKIPGATRFF
jgi:hypothetical protein